MIGSAITNAFQLTSRFMFSVAKKAKMELTLRTPYSTSNIYVRYRPQGFRRVLANNHQN
jgi:hypothetical protein